MIKNMKIMDGNEAVAYVAYRVTEVNAIYPITPSTSMGELADQWSADGIKNIWNTVPQVVEMQSEAGAAGALHGALQTGALATTYTASQGLLLMLPNMYKIAGELTSAVIHVASRSLANQALSIFGDHSDVMGIRDTGFAMIASGSVQEAHDLALVAHAATLEARVPFVHFFEGFRVSSEINKIEGITDEQMQAMIDEDLVIAHRKRALDCEHPCVRGTSQNPDVYFQGRETVNPFYLKVPTIVEKYMDQFAKLTGRKYSLMSYRGDEAAERIIVIIGSGSKTVMQTVDNLVAQGEKVGVVQVYLYRPFSIERFIEILPDTVKSIAVLDRTKEPGSLGEPLYQDILTAVAEVFSAGKLPFKNGYPKIVGGRYGLSSKEFTPAMVKGIFDHIKQDNPKNHFTVGINDDVTNSSLDYDSGFSLDHENQKCSVFYGLGSDGTVGANKNTIKIIGKETDLFVQGYFVYDSKKSGSKTVSHLRFSPEPITAPYLIAKADFIGCHEYGFTESSSILDNAVLGATFLLNSPFGPDEVWEKLPIVVAEKIIAKKLKFYVIDAYKIAAATGMGSRINTIMQTCFFAISGVLPREDAIAKIKDAIVKTYRRKGEEVVKKNFEAVDQTLANLFEVKLLDKVPANAHELKPIVSRKAPEFVQKITATIMDERGDELPVSAMPADGTYPCGTTKWEKRNVSEIVSEWNPDMCIQCGQCSLICPHAVIRVKHFSEDNLKDAPADFKTAKCRAKEFADDQFRLQIYLEDCTGCGLCKEVCPAVNKENRDIKAIMLTPKTERLESERKNIEFFESLPYADRREIDNGSIRGVQYLHPYFEFSGACAGCGETPYVKLITQLFGSRMLVANATGCSSIYGGNLPTTPWTCDAEGRGPAWSNSLFEDNAEFGYGFRLSEDKQQELALELLQEFAGQIGDELTNAIAQGVHEHDEKDIFAQRHRLTELKAKLEPLQDPRAKHLLALLDHLVRRSIWILGGDGWAYDIGYGGLDHVLASNRDVNVLVLDTEVYSNTGGQASKSTPRGAVAKFAVSGKPLARKDLGMMALTYGSVYVAQIAIGANPTQAIRAMLEAEKYPGPSLIIAYSNCIAHGYNLRRGVDQQKLAVNSGFWPLYRYHPDRAKEGLNPLQLDSKEPSIPVRDYAYNEPRFKSLTAQYPEHSEELMKQLQADVNRKWKLYADLAAKKPE
ncbi:MAG: pyruvate:ferredoxin (flavodoxin) oxidoreductase [Gammaproteobacteria bacterium]|nr:pyruvate:ferredoxin (flavodoxin) oxidoreductase [Gammaproteobacteria bacterium]